MKKNYYICLSFTLALLAFLVAMSGLRRKEEALAARIAPGVLRFHVLANSDSPEDQALKLEVKDLLLETIQRDLESEAGASLSKAVVMDYITEHREALEKTAETYMSGRGFSYAARVCLEQCLFPEKTYGDMTFPGGTYDAVRVLLGKGEGKNFWCVLYPSLCYLDSTHAVMPDSSRNQLKAILPEDDFAALMQTRRVPFQASWKEKNAEKTGQNTSRDALPRIKVRFKITELFR